MRRALVLLALGAAAATTPAAAQRFWKNTLYPYFFYSSVDRWWLGGHFAVYAPVGYEERPERWLGAIVVDAAASTEGSYTVIADAQAPGLWKGWRAALTVGAVRANRLGYYGIGNDTPYDPDSVGGPDPYFYAVSRATQQVRATVQRRVAGPVRALAGLVYEHTEYRGLPGGTVFERELAAGALDSSQVRFSDLAGRVGLILDTRDNELDPHRGLFVELLYAASDGYARTTGHARAYVQPWERLTVAGRVAVEGMSGQPPLAPLTLMESSERPFVAVGGYYSQRGYYDGRFAGPGKLLGGIEARYGLLWAPTLFEVKLVGFFDAGRVFAPGEDVELTTEGLHHSGGGMLAARFGRNTLFALGGAAGPEGGRFLFEAGWSF
jgi:hypothetical protein